MLKKLLVLVTVVAMTSTGLTIGSSALADGGGGVFCGFVDVPYTSYYTNAACWLKEEGITTGTSDSTYSPATNVTRAQMATFLWRAAGEPAASDRVFEDEDLIPLFARTATDWMFEQGITINDPYNPATNVTRAQMATFLWRAAGEPAASDWVFDDEDSIPLFARVAVDWMFAQGITINDPYNPATNVTRAQMATFLNRDAGSPVVSDDTFANTEDASAVLWYDTNAGVGTTITLPMHGLGSISVDWGDGTTETFINPNRPTKTYVVDGYYRVKVTGSVAAFGFERAAFPDPDLAPTAARHLLAVSSFGELTTTSMELAFYGATELRRVPIELPASVTSLREMFSGAVNFNQPLSTWNTASITDMSRMFYFASTFNQNISGWNVNNVIYSDEFRLGSSLSDPNTPPEFL